MLTVTGFLPVHCSLDLLDKPDRKPYPSLWSEIPPLPLPIAARVSEVGHWLCIIQ